MAKRKTYSSFVIDLLSHKPPNLGQKDSAVEYILATVETNGKEFNIGAAFIPLGSTPNIYSRGAKKTKSIAENIADCDYTTLSRDFN